MIDKDVLNSFGIDYDTYLKRFLDDPDFYEAVLSAFINDDLPDRANAAYVARDGARLFSVIHEAKGSSGNAGLEKLYDVSCKFVEVLRDGDCTETELKEGYEEFMNTYAATKDCIRAALGQ